MKIALVGAQGVGKTTLGKTLELTYKKSYLVRETVRECPYPADAQADFKTEWWVLSHSILAEQEAKESGASLIITDRCLLDIAVYSKLIQEAGDGRVTKRQREMIDHTIDQWFMENPYDMMFFLKVSTDVWKRRDLDDGFRSLDLEWYLRLTAEYESVLERFDIAKRTRLVTIHNDGSFQATLDQVKHEIGKTTTVPLDLKANAHSH
ncbi:MAG: ATP-binding protein [Bdellovibrionales bacterium]|nr:ATP-binding protein [Bdellovibrionales bacterium]